MCMIIRHTDQFSRFSYITAVKKHRHSFSVYSRFRGECHKRTYEQDLWKSRVLKNPQRVKEKI